MIHFIAVHPFIALLIVIFAVLLVTLVIGGGALVAAAERMPEPSDIEPEDLIDPEFPCSWCQVERAIKAQPRESHGICKRHAAQLLAESKRLNHAA